jgi:hypothetical protein
MDRRPSFILKLFKPYQPTRDLVPARVVSKETRAFGAVFSMWTALKCLKDLNPSLICSFSLLSSIHIFFGHAV